MTRRTEDTKYPQTFVSIPALRLAVQVLFNFLGKLFQDIRDRRSQFYMQSHIVYRPLSFKIPANINSEYEGAVPVGIFSSVQSYSTLKTCSKS